MNTSKISKSCVCYSPKIIPLAFDESMSYYENICGLVAKMNEIIDFANNELTEKIEAYINEQFNNIMLDTMYDAETETLTMFLVRESD